MNKLENFVDVDAGQGAPQNPDFFNKHYIGYPFIRAGSLAFLCEGKNIQECEFIDDNVAKSHKLKLYPKNSIVFAKSGMSSKIGRIYQLKCDAYIVNHLAILKPKHNLYAKFLEFYLQYYNPRQLIKDDAYPSINLKDIREIEVNFPPLPEQKRIAAILDKADSLRRLRREAIEKLSSLSQAIFYEMFGNPCTQTKWAFPVFDLSFVCNKITDGTHQSPKWSESGIPFIFVSNVKEQKISLETKKFVTIEEYNRLTKNTPVEYGDVLYTCVGSYGNTAVVNFNEKFIFQRHIAHLKLDKTKILPYYLSMCLETDILRRQADRVATGIAQKTVTLTVLKKLSIPLPPIELQNDYENKIKAIDRLLNLHRKNLEHSESLFLSLQQKAFMGEL